MVSGGIQGLCWPSNGGRAVLPSCRVLTGITLTREKSKSNRIRPYSTERNVTLINLANPACYGGATVTVTVTVIEKKNSKSVNQLISQS